MRIFHRYLLYIIFCENTIIFLMKKYNELHKNSVSTKKTSKRRKILLAAVIALFALPLVAIAVGTLSFAIWAHGQSIDANLLPTASALPVFYDCNGEKIEIGSDPYVQSDEVPDFLKNAFVAIEDKRFFKHKGYDIVRIGGALAKNIKAGKIAEGASTITQQLVKNTHLSAERSVKRKLMEIALAVDLEKKYSKDEILNMYMSVIYFGKGSYGVKSAAENFFGKTPAELTLAECATLAGLVKNPAGYSPIAHPDSCRKRRDLVLKLMCEQGYITEEERSVASREPVKTAAVRDVKDPGLKLYVELAKREACEKLGITKYMLDNSGVKIFTNLDLAAQRILEAERLDSDNFESADVASFSTVIDNASGGVLAISSTYPYGICRQTGSVLKPLAVYAPALDAHTVSLATPVVDEKIKFGDFAPENFGGVYYGDTTVEEGIKKSMNSVSVKVLDYLGLDNSVKYLNKFGLEVSDEDKNYSLALGALSASPLDVAAAYSALARGGGYQKANFVRYVVMDGAKYQFEDETRPAVSPAAAALTSRALIQTVNDGTARALRSLPFEVAAKTGTAERGNGANSDAWLASYNSSLTVLVWHGSESGMSERGGGYPTYHAREIWTKLGEVKNFDNAIDLDGGTVPLKVDVYSSQKLGKVVLASKNTPLEYTKTQYFDKAFLPQSAAGLFDSVAPCPLIVDVKEGSVELSFDTYPIHTYSLYRTDLFGKALIFCDNGTGDRTTVNDVPIGFGNFVKYELVCSLKNDPTVSASSYKSVFFEPGAPFFDAYGIDMSV